MKNKTFSKTLLFLFVFTLSFVTTIYTQVTCQTTSTVTRSGSCYNYEITTNCSGGQSCSSGFGGCDWGDVTATWDIEEVCNY